MTSRKQGKFLVSKRFDVFKYDVLEQHWPFYDSYHSSLPTRAAIVHQTNSIQGANLDRFLSAAKKPVVPLSIQELVAQMPAPFDTLLALQNDTGLFTDLAGVLKCLSLPKQLRQMMPRAKQDSEMATALALAAMRQRIDLFEVLQDAHDRAIQHVHSGILLEATNLLIDYKLTESEHEIEYGKDNNDEQVSSFPQNPPTSPAHAPRKHAAVTNVTTEVQLQENSDARVNDERIDTLSVELTDKFILLDAIVEDSKSCLTRCVHKYLHTEQLGEKNSAFDELTCRLGEGCDPQEGFRDWRKLGVPGLRPLIMDILNGLFILAELRVKCKQERMAVSSNTLARSAQFKHNFSDGDRGRFSFYFNGENGVIKIIHCLDFLRNCRELSGWYGHKYSYLGNPLQLPFDMRSSFFALGMEEKIASLLNGRGTAQYGVDKDDEYEEQQYFTNWSAKFDALCARSTQWNWPNIPSTRRLDAARRMHNALVVLYAAGWDDIQRTVAYEIEFNNLVKAGRGHHLMQGKIGMKPNRKLLLPLETAVIESSDAVLKCFDTADKRVRKSDKQKPRGHR